MSLQHSALVAPDGNAPFLNPALTIRCAAMRWLYIDDHDKEEDASRAAVLSRIERWWTAFADNAGELKLHFESDSDFDVPAFMREYLESIDQRIGWEFGPALDGDGDRLVITPEDNLRLRPLCDAIIARAPDVEGWEFYHGRVAETPEFARASVEGETGAELGRCRVQTHVDEMNRVALRFYLPDCDDIELGGVQASIASESLMGEEAFARWVGRVDMVERESGDAWAPLDALKRHVFAEVATIDGTLPDTALVSNPDALKWSLWRLSPPKQSEYPRQQDLIMGSSALDKMSACAQLGLNFDSRRYSKVGETFCFLKFDGEGRKVGPRMKERKEIEKRVNRALTESKLGCVVGTGTGKQYSYLDLALVKVDDAIPLIREQMQQGGVANRSWLLFHDAHLGDEWIGVYDDTPPPPR